MELGPVIEPVRSADPVFNVLLVCTANICRSPGAERLLARELSERELSDALPIKIRSAGMRGRDAAPMDRDAAVALEALGGSANGFLSRPISELMVADAHLILTATREHRSELVERFPRGLRRTFTMKEFAQLTDRDDQRLYDSARDLVAAAYRRRGGAELTELDIADPYGGSAKHHATAMTEIHASMSTVANALSRCSYP